MLNMRIFALLGLLLLLGQAAVATGMSSEPRHGTRDMTALDDSQMTDVVAQGLFVSDKIDGSNMLGGSTIWSAYSSPYTFYRMGLDAKLSMNMNMSKLQLGCGGVNDAISTGAACDIDIDYVRFMGVDSTGLLPAGYPATTGTTGGDSAFTMIRPYIEIAVKNDANPALREVVGIKIGAASINGALAVGRTYATGQNNLENGQYGDTASGGTPNAGAATPTCNTGADFGNATLACTSGINSISGFLGAELSTMIHVKANTSILGINTPLDTYGCAGRMSPTSLTSGHCTSGGTYPNNPLFMDAAGTRMSSLTLGSVPLAYDPSSFMTSFLSALGFSQIYATMYADLRLLHFVTFSNTQDFFLSFQRERIAYPSYSKQPLYQSVASGNPQYDECGFMGNAGRCASSYAYPANTGWWMNAPVAKLLNIIPANAIDMGNISLGTLIGALGPPGIYLPNPNFGLQPTRNCYGSAQFC